MTVEDHPCNEQISIDEFVHYKGTSIPKVYLVHLRSQQLASGCLILVYSRFTIADIWEERPGTWTLCRTNRMTHSERPRIVGSRLTRTMIRFAKRLEIDVADQTHLQHLATVSNDSAFMALCRGPVRCNNLSHLWQRFTTQPRCLNEGGQLSSPTSWLL